MLRCLSFLFFSFFLPNLNNKNGEVQSVAQGQGWTKSLEGESTSPRVKWERHDRRQTDAPCGDAYFSEIWHDCASVQLEDAVFLLVSVERGDCQGLQQRVKSRVDMSSGLSWSHTIFLSSYTYCFRTNSQRRACWVIGKSILHQISHNPLARYFSYSTRDALLINHKKINHQVSNKYAYVSNDINKTFIRRQVRRDITYQCTQRSFLHL